MGQRWTTGNCKPIEVNPVLLRSVEVEILLYWEALGKPMLRHFTSLFDHDLVILNWAAFFLFFFIFIRNKEDYINKRTNTGEKLSSFEQTPLALLIIGGERFGIFGSMDASLSWRPESANQEVDGLA